MRYDESLGSGVYFDLRSYPGLFRRLLAILIDLLFVFFVAALIWIILLSLLWNKLTEPMITAYWGVLYLFSIWFYLAVIKRSRFGTIGYRLLGLQVVTIQGERPSLLAMTFRLLMWAVGPFNLLVDVVWLGADTENQALRDCYAGTYVIRSQSVPLGSGPIHLTRYFGAGLAPSYPRVGRAEQETCVAHNASNEGRSQP